MKQDERRKDSMLALFVVGGVAVSALMFVFTL
jgi:hypothetical protein